MSTPDRRQPYLDPELQARLERELLRWYEHPDYDGKDKRGSIFNRPKVFYLSDEPQSTEIVDPREKELFAITNFPRLTEAFQKQPVLMAAALQMTGRIGNFSPTDEQRSQVRRFLNGEGVVYLAGENTAVKMKYDVGRRQIIDGKICRERSVTIDGFTMQGDWGIGRSIIIGESPRFLLIMKLTKILNPRNNKWEDNLTGRGLCDVGLRSFGRFTDPERRDYRSETELQLAKRIIDGIIGVKENGFDRVRVRRRTNSGYEPVPNGRW